VESLGAAPAENSEILKPSSEKKWRSSIYDFTTVPPPLRPAILRVYCLFFISSYFKSITCIMFTSKSIAAEHKDLIQDVAYDFHGKRMATCSCDQHVKVRVRDSSIKCGLRICVLYNSVRVRVRARLGLRLVSKFTFPCRSAVLCHSRSCNRAVMP